MTQTPMVRTALPPLFSGVLSATLYVFGAAGLLAGPLLLAASAVPLLAIGLLRGPRHCEVALAAALLVVVTAAGAATGGIYALVFGVPTWLMVRVAFMAVRHPSGALRMAGPGALLTVLAFYWLIGFAVAWGAAAGEDGGLIGVIRRLLALQMADAAALTGLTVDSLAGWPDRLAPIWPGVVATIWLVIMTVSLFAAQAAAQRLGMVRPAFRLAGMRLPRGLSIVFAAALALSVMGPAVWATVATNIALAIGCLYFLAGLGVIHGWSGRRGAHSPWIGGAWIGAAYFCVIAFAWPAVAVVGLGLAQQWMRPDVTNSGAGGN